MTKSLRFCMVTTFFPPHSFGGDALFVQNLAGELQNQGHHVEVIHCLDSYRMLGGRSTTEERPRGSGNRPVVHRLKSRLGWLSPFATHQTGQPIGKRMQIEAIFDRGFDVIHFHNLSLVGGPGLLPSGSAVKLYTMHECWLVCPTHVLQKYGRSPCKSPMCALCSLVHRRPPQLWRRTKLLERCLDHVDAFIAPSRFSAELHRRRFPDLPIVTIPNFVPVADGSRRNPGGWRDEPYFLFVGRLERIKGLHTVIPVFKAHPSLRLLVAGRGSEEDALRRLAGNAPNIEFLGFRSGNELAKLFEGAAAVIIPSLVQEIFPLVILESFRQSTPAVVRNLGGMPEIVESSGGGFVYSADDELLEILKKIIANPTERDSMGANARAAFDTHWTPESHLGRYLDLVESIRDGRFRIRSDPEWDAR